jgi:hypothetical protein
VITVAYDYEFPYSNDESGDLFPRITVRVSNAASPTSSLDVVAYLDSGAQASLFAGFICQAVGLQTLDGEQRTYRTASGAEIDARLHDVRLAHPNLGEFALKLGFTIQPLSRNLLGRDFFNLIQIGFREHHSKFLVAIEPP